MEHEFIQRLRYAINYAGTEADAIGETDWYRGLDIVRQDDVAGVLLDIDHSIQELHRHADRLRKWLP